ncbi:MAG TPA: hypothetical protein VFG63_13635 [Nocardioidaceae bacterium]|nr:hypothetical protein [Nocardioidaceae bacterium]
MSTNPALSPLPIPEQYLRLVDDAAIFPPGDAPLPRAVSEHRAHRAASYAGLVGTFVVSDVRLPDLIQVVREGPGGGAGEPVATTVVVTGGAGALGPAVVWAGRADEVELRGVEIALRDETDLAHNAQRMTTAIDQLLAAGDLAEDVPVYLEPPRPDAVSPSHSWLAALDEAAAMDLRLKFRTGGVSADAFPGAAELATCIEAALDRELAFKCTAGLHHAVRHRDPETGFEHHGFLNVLLATRASLDGAATEEVAAVLDLAERDDVTARVREAGADGLISARRWFTSFGSCSVRDALQDLTDLDLLPAENP